MRAPAVLLRLLVLAPLMGCGERTRVDEQAPSREVAAANSANQEEEVSTGVPAPADDTVPSALGEGEDDDVESLLRRLEECELADCREMDEIVARGEAVRPALMGIALDPHSTPARRRGALEALARLQPPPEQRDLATHARSLWEGAKQIEDRPLRHAHYRALAGTRSDDALLFGEVRDAILAADQRRDEEEQISLQRALRAFPSHTVPFALHALRDPKVETRLYARVLGECATEADLPLLSAAMRTNLSPLVSILLARVMVQLGEVGEADRLCEELEAIEAEDEAAREQLLRRQIDAARAITEVARKLTREQRIRALRALEAGLDRGDAQLRDPYREAADRLRELDPTPAPASGPSPG